MFNDSNASDPTHSVLSKVFLTLGPRHATLTLRIGSLWYHFERACR